MAWEKRLGIEILWGIMAWKSSETYFWETRKLQTCPGLPTCSDSWEIPYPHFWLIVRFRTSRRWRLRQSWRLLAWVLKAYAKAHRAHLLKLGGLFFGSRHLRKSVINCYLTPRLTENLAAIRDKEYWLYNISSEESRNKQTAKTTASSSNSL